MEKVGLYLGTFDPFHNGHYSLIQRALKNCKTIIIQPHHNRKKAKNKHTPLEDRLEMIKLALGSLASRIIIRVEQRDVYSTAKDNKFRLQLINWVQEEINGLWVLMGSDKLENPMYFSGELLEIPHLIFLRRPYLEGKAPNNLKNFRVFPEVSSVSAFKIKKMLEEGQNIQRFVPPRVLEYIRGKNLYSK